MSLGLSKSAMEGGGLGPEYEAWGRDEAMVSLTQKQPQVQGCDTASELPPQKNPLIHVQICLTYEVPLTASFAQPSVRSIARRCPWPSDRK